jgi:hypothetical protein
MRMRTRWYYPTRYDQCSLTVEVHVRLNREEQSRLARILRQQGEITLPFWNTISEAEPLLVLTQEDDCWEQDGLTRREAITALADMLSDELAALRGLLRAS